jgi:RNA polymerase sigma-70 factor (ECF subfamily)
MDNKLSLDREKELIAECKKDLSKFGELYKGYVTDVYRYVYVVIKNKEKAEDITSQTFLTGIEKINNFKWRGISIKYWFLKIARNLVSKQFAKPKDLSFDEKLEIKDLDNMLLSDVVIEEELKAKLKELVFQLDGPTREVISLRIWDDMKFKHISQFLWMKESTIKSRFNRGIDKLKKLLENENKGKKLYSVNLPSIVIGVKYLWKFPEFLPSAELSNNIATQVLDKITLFISKRNMNQVQSTQPLSESPKQVEVSSPNLGQVSAGRKGSKVIKLVLSLLGVVAVAVISAAAGYFFSESRKEDPKPVVSTKKEDDTTTEETTATTITVAEVDPYEGWKTYTKEWVVSGINYSMNFKYPSNWQVVESDDYDKGFAESNVSILTQDSKYGIEIATFGPTDSIPCYYTEESCNADQGIGPKLCFDSHEELIGEYFTFRTGLSGNEDEAYVVCGGVPDGDDQVDFKQQLVSQENDIYYTSGYITYQVPDESDIEVEKEIELILRSLSK